MINVEDVKQKILAYLNERGPSLPIPISREVKLSSMFASAILSELLNEKKVKLSNLRVGSSPLYLIPGQEPKLENFSDNLKSIEKEAYIKLKDNKILEDEKQEPKIRVALRSIKDFAIPIQYKSKLFWKYFIVSNENALQSLRDDSQEEVAVGEKVIGQKIWEDIKKQEIRKEEFIEREKEFEIKKQELVEQEVSQEVSQEVPARKVENIFEKPKENQIQKKPRIKKQKKGNDSFLIETKELLAKREIEIINIESFNKKQIIARVKIPENQEKEFLLFAFNKKTATEKDILKASKKAASLNLKYIVLTKAEATKKIQETINAYKNLLKIDKIN